MRRVSFPTHLRPDDRVIVAPFTKTLGAVTGPTSDRDTIVGAIERIEARGGTAILNSLVSAAEQLRTIDSRHILVLITDGYDENSDVAFERALDAVKSSEGHGVCDCDRRQRRHFAEGRDAAQASGHGNGRPGVLSRARVPVERRARPDRRRRAAAVRPDVHAEEPGAGRHVARDYGEDDHAHARGARAVGLLRAGAAAHPPADRADDSRREPADGGYRPGRSAGAGRRRGTAGRGVSGSRRRRCPSSWCWIRAAA